MKKKLQTKTIFMILAIVAFTFVVVGGLSFAWFVTFRTQVIVTSGDASISVEGWRDVVSNPDDAQFTAENKLTSTEITQVESDAGQYIAYKFTVTNNSTRGAYLSMRLSNLFDYIFSPMEGYIANQSSMTDADFTALAKLQNGRLSFAFENIRYEYTDGDGVVVKGNVTDTSSDVYVWKYSRGERFLGGKADDVRNAIPSIFLPATVDGTATPVDVYMTVNNKQDATAIDNYRKWMLGDNGNTGEGKIRAANLLGYSYDNLPAATRTAVDTYLEKFVAAEIKSLNPEEDVGAQANLSFDYFEFIGENAPLVFS